MVDWYDVQGSTVTVHGPQSVQLRAEFGFRGPASALLAGATAVSDPVFNTDQALWEGVFFERASGGNCASTSGAPLTQGDVVLELQPGRRWSVIARFCPGDWPRREELLVVDLRCRADLNGDGGVTVDDLEAFLSAFEAGSSAADISGGVSAEPDGGVDISDLLAFLSAFEGGC